MTMIIWWALISSELYLCESFFNFSCLVGLAPYDAQQAMGTNGAEVSLLVYEELV